MSCVIAILEYYSAPSLLLILIHIYNNSCRFTLNYDRVELTLGVTIIQEVAPSISFSNPGDTEFRSQPEDNPWDLTPITCTNESSGSVHIDPVVLDPWFVHWSDVESTLTESPTSTYYITINEQFNMTILACMPESFTSIHLFVQLPNISSVPLVTVNDAYVTFIGSELYNTTLFEGDCKWLQFLFK